jgi:hypothetical protein
MLKSIKFAVLGMLLMVLITPPLLTQAFAMGGGGGGGAGSGAGAGAGAGAAGGGAGAGAGASGGGGMGGGGMGGGGYTGSGDPYAGAYGSSYPSRLNNELQIHKVPRSHRHPRFLAQSAVGDRSSRVSALLSRLTAP